VLRSVAGCGAGGSEPGPPSTAPSPPAGVARCSDDAVLGLLRRCAAVAGGAVDGMAAAAAGSGPATVMLLNDSGNSVCRSLPLAGVARPGWCRPRHGLGRAGGDPDAARGWVHRCRDPYGRGRCVQQLLRCAQHGSQLTNQTSSPTVASPRGRPPWAAGRVKTPFLFPPILVSTDPHGFRRWW
jgi:hypothetical protein